jgi:tetratricopeptide (TPR) repeat protein
MNPRAARTEPQSPERLKPPAHPRPNLNKPPHQQPKPKDSQKKEGGLGELIPPAFRFTTSMLHCEPFSTPWTLPRTTAKPDRMLRRRTPEPAPLPPITLAQIREASAETLAAAFAAPPEEAARWIAAAARAGHKEAALLYGQILADGRGVKQDRSAAFGWFRVAAEAGDVRGTNMLGRCHELGWGTPTDFAAAAALYAQAADRGYDWAQYNLAGLYARGAGVPEDRASALELFRAAAEQGHAKSLTVLGRFLEEGWHGAPRDPAAAYALYVRAAQGGDFRAQFNLGTLLVEDGRLEEALPWFQQAASNGSPDMLTVMAERLSLRPEPALRDLAAAIATQLER